MMDPIRRITLSPSTELRISLQVRAGKPVADIRLFENCAGPANVKGPTKAGLTIATADLGAVIEGLRAAEVASRVQGVTT